MDAVSSSLVSLYRGFNGAATARSRMVGGPTVDFSIYDASMGPRPLGRGWPQGRVSTLSGLGRFNGAATARSRMEAEHQPVGVERVGASMGPRPLGRGWHLLYAAGRCKPGVASMGPRPLGRGWRAARLSSKLSKAASMGPRPLGRGWRRLFNRFLWVFRLQWGRDR